MPSNDDPTLADKEAILASLNIKAMTFDDTIGVLNHSKKIDDDHVNGHMKQIVAINDEPDITRYIVLFSANLKPACSEIVSCMSVVTFKLF